MQNMESILICECTWWKKVMLPCEAKMLFVLEWSQFGIWTLLVSILVYCFLVIPFCLLETKRIPQRLDNHQTRRGMVAKGLILLIRFYEKETFQLLRMVFLTQHIHVGGSSLSSKALNGVNESWRYYNHFE